MLKDKYPRLIELERQVNKIFLDNRREPEKGKQLATSAVADMLSEYSNPDLKIDDLIDHLEDQAQENQDFSVFGIVEILREYQ